MRLCSTQVQSAKRKYLAVRDFCQLRQIKSGVFTLGRSLAFWCHVTDSKLFSQFCMHAKFFSHKGDIASRAACTNPNDYSGPAATV